MKTKVFGKKDKFDEKVKFDKNVKFGENVEFDKKKSWEKSQIWEKCQLLMYPPPPPIVYIWYHIFAGPKWNFEKTKRKQNLLCNSNSCDLDAELEIWAALRWKLLLQYSRWFTVLDKFSQSWPNCTILTKIYIPNFIILTKIHNSGLYGAGV